MTAAHPITDAAQAFAFLLAGKATFTVRSEKTGDHLTFSVRKWAKAKNGTMHFVSVRTGNDFAKVGFIADGKDYWLGKHAELPTDDKRIKAFRYVFDNLRHHQRMPPKCEVWHEGVCGRCCRPLTDPESIARGIGPECIKKMGG